MAETSFLLTRESSSMETREPRVPESKESLFETIQELCLLVDSVRKAFNEYLNDFVEGQNGIILEDHSTLSQIPFLTEEEKKEISILFFAINNEINQNLNNPLINQMFEPISNNLAGSQSDLSLKKNGLISKVLTETRTMLGQISLVLFCSDDLDKYYENLKNATQKGVNRSLECFTSFNEQFLDDQNLSDLQAKISDFYKICLE
jgi:hypothetical protein